MQKLRIVYFCIILLIILFGLASRQLLSIPLMVGDVLWASMIYFLLRLIAVKSQFLVIAITSFSLCIAIEISQLYHAVWLDELRQTLPGKLILGNQFLSSDILAYSFGVSLAVAIDLFVSRKMAKS